MLLRRQHSITRTHIVQSYMDHVIPEMDVDHFESYSSILNVERNVYSLVKVTRLHRTRSSGLVDHHHLIPVFVSAELRVGSRTTVYRYLSRRVEEGSSRSFRT